TARLRGTKRKIEASRQQGRKTVRRRSYLPEIQALEDRWLPSALQFIQNIGVNTNFTTTDTALSITVPAAGVANGQTIVVELSLDPSPGAASVTDGAGNTYHLDKEVTFSTGGSGKQGARVVIFSAEGVNALASGQLITVHYPSVKAKAISAAEFCGI